MRRVLFSWSGFNIYSYPAMLYLGMVAGVFAGAHAAHLSGMNPNKFAAASVLLIVPALVGSRLFFVFTHWDLYRGHYPVSGDARPPPPTPPQPKSGLPDFGAS
jgi:prolipoprotein diacylglyceryltransferase